jgi:hypothetical protein
MKLALDHIIIRSATPEETLGALAAQAGAPVLAPVEEVRGLASGILRAGPIDIEVLRIGDDQPGEPQGYGIGLVADAGLDAAVARLRELGLGTSAAPRVAAGGRSWRAAQVHGLLPDPFPVPVSARRPGWRDRLSEAAAGTLSRIPAVARAATRRAGGSMVVVTEYAFDVAAWRASAGIGPRVLAVELGTGGHGAAWDRLPLAGDVRMHRDDAGPAGIRRVVFAGAGPGFSAGAVEFAFAG